MSHENALIARGQTHTRMSSVQEQHFGIYADNPRWIEHALCAQVGGDLWFPEMGGGTREAKRICRSCPVRETCLEYAMEHDETTGIWGGLSGNQRRALKRKRAA